ncbi:DUF4181 domain-containing protein [Heyndrickxia sporothermodurans]|uniref:DUF4181 domain-containing protein n=1 Tax=Heyndrickxia sporothermodurans TaxID=46224 RepID=UPI0008258B13|nr:DUF4181 domain-containing protein [Heyndrickxia sporothermodurans]
MIKSLKGQFILSIFVTICFVITTFSNVEFNVDKSVLPIRIIFFFIMIVSVFNTGLLTEKYIQTRKKRK